MSIKRRKKRFVVGAVLKEQGWAKVFFPSHIWAQPKDRHRGLLPPVNEKKSAPKKVCKFSEESACPGTILSYRNPGAWHIGAVPGQALRSRWYTLFANFNNKTGFEGFSMMQNGKQQTKCARRAHGCTAPVKLHLFLKLSVPLLVGVSPVTHAFFPPSLPCTALTPFFGLFGVHKFGNHRNGQAACLLPLQCIVMCILSSAAGCCLTDSGVFCFVCVSAWAVGDSSVLGVAWRRWSLRLCTYILASAYH